jgi:hypothetical protein
MLERESRCAPTRWRTRQETAKHDHSGGFGLTSIVMAELIVAVTGKPIFARTSVGSGVYEAGKYVGHDVYARGILVARACSLAA